MSDTVVFWDIDGTLLTTARAGVVALEDAAVNVLGATVHLTDVPTAGLTDAEVAQVVIRLAGADPSDDLVCEFLREYERQLPSRLPLRPGCVLPGVEPILRDLEARGDVHSLLLTGNTRAGARAKLAHYGIDRYFDRGAFTEDDVFDRPSIARYALALARRTVPHFDSERVYLVGDTPHDIACGDAISASTIAVATGSYTVEDLSAHRPWRTLEQLPPPAEFAGILALL